MIAPSPFSGAGAPADRAGEMEFEFQDADFAFLARVVHQRTGIVLSETKRHMVYSRLARRLRALSLRSFAQYRNMLEGPEGDQEMARTVNAITTNLTRFYRESHHFEHLAHQALPQLRRDLSERRLRLWSAGCSSGEEAYTIALTLADHLPPRERWDARILATDLDSDMVAQARAGTYSAESCEAVPEAVRERHFMPGDRPGRLALRPDVRERITFKVLNLLGDWPMTGPFHVIFCRNVVIYFDRPTQKALFDRFADILIPGGYLYVGHSENLYRLTDRFKLLGRTVYRRVP